MFLLLLLLPLDLSAATTAAPSEADGLRLEAVLHGTAVSARLTNTTTHAIDVVVGYTCGDSPFTAVVDDVARPFHVDPNPCTGNARVIQRIEAHARFSVESETQIEEHPHRMSVRYRQREAGTWQGTLASATRSTHFANLVVWATARRMEGNAVELMMYHRWYGGNNQRFLQLWVGVCPHPQDTLFVDDKPQSFIETACAGPAFPVLEQIGPGKQFVNRGVVHLPPGPHRLRVVYRVTEDDLEMATVKGNIGDWVGDVEAPEITIP